MSRAGWQDGRKIRELRKQRGIDRIEFAARIQILPQSLSHLELNNKQARLDTLIRIARELEVPVDEVIRPGLDDDAEDEPDGAAA
jgi:transcriptional regulator with XRE-family HTH domain